MESASSTVDNNIMCYKNWRNFPSTNSDTINIVEFIERINNLIAVVDGLGKVFAPVKYDMQGNIDKLKKVYNYDEDSCLLELMRQEIDNGTPIAAEGVLWLNRALLFFELLFQEILTCVKAGNRDGSIKKMLKIAYDGSVKKYHNWVTQKLFHVISNMAPSLHQILKIFQVNGETTEFATILESYNASLHHIRIKIDNFFLLHNNIFNAA